MMVNWGEATAETDADLRQVHYTLKLFRLVYIQVHFYKLFYQKSKMVYLLAEMVKPLIQKQTGPK